MTIANINIGTNPNDGTGDSLRTSFEKCNNNFSYLNSVFLGTGNISANSLTITGNVLLGESLSFTPPGAALQYGGTANSYVQMVIQNKSSLTNASSDYVVTADNGNDSAYFGDFGIASSTYYYTGYDSILPNDTYLIANGGDLLLNAGSPGKAIKFVANGSNTSDIAGQFSNTGLVINPATISTGVGSGALQVAGGASIDGNVYLTNAALASGGLVSSGEFTGIFNDGVAIDYITGNGRISLGSASDGLKIYNDGIAGTQLAEISNTGNLTVTGDINAVSSTLSGNLLLTTSNSSIASGGGFNLIAVNALAYRVASQLGTNATVLTANLIPGTAGVVGLDVNANITISYSGTIVGGVERKYFIRNVGGSSANIILPNSNNNKASNVVLINTGVVASVTITSIDTTEANVVATIINN